MLLLLMVMMMVIMGWLRGGGKRDPLAALDDGPLHRDGAVNVVELEVQPTCIADRVTGLVASPERGGICAAVGADQRLAVRLMLVEGGATVAAGGSARAVAVTVGGTRSIAGLVGRLGGGFLDGIALERGRTVDVAGLEVEATRVANRLSIRGSPPKRSHGRATV